jgi:D-amino-acid oxidase
MKENASVAIIGSGIIGMTTALCLSRAGYRPIVISKDDVSETTSAVAAAFWYPFKAEPMHKVSGWAQQSLSVFREEQHIPDAGVVWHEFSELLAPDAEIPWWHASVDGFRCDEHLTDLPAGRRRACYFNVPVIDTTMDLTYLEKSLRERSVPFERMEIHSIDEVFKISETVVNCTGLGAVQLMQDFDLHPARGQVVRIKRKPNHRPVIDVTQDPKLAHVTPRIHDTILGGTYENNVSSIEPSQTTTAEIIARCKLILPELGHVPDEEILGVSCGLRPVRSAVRVEGVRVDKGWLFHNYGHGGAGFTLAWGCAEEICALVGAAATES